MPVAVVPKRPHGVVRPGNRVLTDRHIPIRVLETAGVLPPARGDRFHPCSGTMRARPCANRKAGPIISGLNSTAGSSRTSPGAIPNRSTALVQSRIMERLSGKVRRRGDLGSLGMATLQGATARYAAGGVKGLYHRQKPMHHAGAEEHRKHAPGSLLRLTLVKHRAQSGHRFV